MTVKGNHPLAEIIAKKLFGIESVPIVEQRKMVNRAAKAAVAWHDEQIYQQSAALKAAREALEEVGKRSDSAVIKYREEREYHGSGGTEYLDGYSSGLVEAMMITRAALARIDALNPKEKT